MFAAEAVAKLQRRPGLAVLTAGPGRHQRHLRHHQRLLQRLPGASCSAAGRRSSAGAAGSLQEIDHLPLVAPVTKHAATVVRDRRRRRPPCATAAADRADPAPRPGLPRLPAGGDLLPARPTLPAATGVAPIEPDPDEVARAAALIAGAQRPVIIAGSDVYAGDAVAALREAAEALQVPVFTNGMGRGALPPEHPLAFAKARRARAQAAPTWSWWSAPRWTSGSASATSARRRSSTSSTRPASAPATSRRPSRPPVTCG